MRQLLLVLLLLSVAGQCESQLAPGPWADPSLPPAQRAELLLANLTLAEKVGLLHGTNGRTFGFSAGVQRLGVPGVSSIAWTGPGSGPTMTAWPTGLAIAATFDDSAAAAWGKGKGEEAFEKGGNVDIEIPLCLTRTPNNGRAWEYLSGEDPFLGAKVAAAAVRAVQAEGIVANVKHGQAVASGYLGADVDTQIVDTERASSLTTEARMLRSPTGRVVVLGHLQVTGTIRVRTEKEDTGDDKGGNRGTGGADGAGNGA